MQWHPTPVLLPGKIPWTEEPGRLQPMGSLESDTAKRLHFHFSLSCIGEGNGNPLQYSCLEDPRDRGAWWAAVYGVAQSQTRLKRLSKKRNFHELRYGEVILTYTRVKMNFMLTKTTYFLAYQTDTATSALITKGNNTST